MVTGQADKPKAGRDIESLMRYHEAHKKGRTDDDCLREKFGRSAKIETHPCECRQRDDGTWVHLDESCKVHGLAPTPPQSADGGQPLPSAGSKPHGKDVDTADGPWPKCLFGMKDGKIRTCIVYTSNETGVFWWNREEFTHPESAAYTYDFNSRRTDMTTAANETAASWLEQNGHADVAAQLWGKEEFEPAGTIAREGDTVVWPWHQYDSWRRVPHTLRYTAPCVGFDAYYDGYLEDVFSKPDGDPLALRVLKRPLAPRADVAIGGGRVWKNCAPRHTGETCYEHWRAVLVGGKVYTRGAWDKPGVWSGKASDVPSVRELESGGFPELFGPERDAILSECRKAMGL